jgi:N-acetylglucosaminyldiphosphoundecaprenol N-acetyl-beta-D-mannosaminyltransferase
VFLKYFKDAQTKDILDKFTLIYDGIGMHLALKYFFDSQVTNEKIVSTDLWNMLLSELNRNGEKVFFYGGWEKSFDNLKKNIQKLYPELLIVGFFNGINSLNENDIEHIANSGASVLFVGLGTPLQEKWILENKDRLNIPLIIACGSAIDFLSGFTKRAPQIIRTIHFEWIYRLLQHPGRLWKRYLIGIPVFVFKVLIIKVKFIKKSRLV